MVFGGGGGPRANPPRIVGDEYCHIFEESEVLCRIFTAVGNGATHPLCSSVVYCIVYIF